MLLLYIWANFRCFGSYGCNDTVHICAKLRKYQAMLQHSAKGLVPQIWCSERCRLRIREKTSRLQEVYTTWKCWKVAWDSEPPILISITRIVGDLTYHEPSIVLPAHRLLMTLAIWRKWHSRWSMTSGVPRLLWHHQCRLLQVHQIFSTHHHFTRLIFPVTPNHQTTTCKSAAQDSWGR